ncbi:olfactory receptor 5B17-like [Discoglossus pictus]
MQKTNETTVNYFILTGLSNIPSLQIPIFLLVLFIYLITLAGNMTILLLICLDSHLHTPMYFFLGNLSIMDMSSITTTLHRVLSNFITGDNTISFLGCIAQFYVFSALTNDELLLLTAMSYDRYVAICNPLHYQVVMNHRVCGVLATGCYLLGFIEIIPYVVLFSSYTCYKSNIIHHFICDYVPLIKLYCSDTSILELYIIIQGSSFSISTPFILTVLPYVFIINSILKIRTNTGRRKAFYTCSSHLTVVFLLYIILVLQYSRPTSIEDLESSKFFSLFNTVAVPLLNPLIYSLKNNAVKTAFRRKLLCVKAKA